MKEGEVLNLLSSGLSNGEIAKQLWLSPQTVKFHLSSVYRKLDVSSRMAAVQLGCEKGLISNPMLPATSRFRAAAGSTCSFMASSSAASPDSA